jgi:uncharacterized hydrophobic protein (TIGR00271 family)
MNERDTASVAATATPTRNPIFEWWSDTVIGTVNHREAIERVHDEARWSGHYAFMTVMSAGIAVLGLLLSSPAVVIGAMLISPLMGPIIGFGFGLAMFDFDEVKRTLVTTGIGVVMAILFCALIVALSPLQTVTSEIAARTRPNLFDLLVAIFSGLAGSYAMIRGRHGAIVGVAIAVAVMPPLAVMGFGIATFNWAVFWGSGLLFFTNLMAIGFSAAGLARLYGFGHQLSPRQTGFQASFILVTFLALAIPLGISLRQIAWEAFASRNSREVISAQFGDQSRLSQLEVNYDADPVQVTATVLTPTYQRQAEQEASRLLTAMWGRPVAVSINQFRVGTADADASQLAAARAGTAAAEATARLAERLALVSGVSPDGIMIDRAGGIAMVQAVPLPGATIETYRTLEARVAVAEPRWQVRLHPPAAPLPNVAMENDEPTEAGAEAIATAVWGARRLGLPIGVSGGRADQVEAVVAALTEAGVSAEPAPGGAPAPDTIRLRWLAPPQPEE